MSDGQGTEEGHGRTDGNAGGPTRSGLEGVQEGMYTQGWIQSVCANFCNTCDGESTALLLLLLQPMCSLLPRGSYKQVSKQFL